MEPTGPGQDETPAMWLAPGIVPGSSTTTVRESAKLSNEVPPVGPRARWNYEAIRDCLTSERLGSYLSATDDDLVGAFQLYEWNMQASASMLSLTSMVEVVVRNALDRELVTWAAQRGGSTSWFDLAPLDQQGRHDILKARDRATRHGQRPEIHGRVIAELSLGFWRFLVESRYLTSLWVPATHRAFGGATHDLRERRSAVAGRLQQLTYVRNRAAHHEPIHRRDPLKDIHSATTLVSWVSPDAAAWIEGTTNVRNVVAAKPVNPH